MLLALRRRRWASIVPALVEHVVFDWWADTPITLTRAEPLTMLLAWRVIGGVYVILHP